MSFRDTSIHLWPWALWPASLFVFYLDTKMLYIRHTLLTLSTFPVFSLDIFCQDLKHFQFGYLYNIKVHGLSQVCCSWTAVWLLSTDIETHRVSRKAKYMKVANEFLVLISKTNFIAFKYGMYCVLAVIYICTIFKYWFITN